MFAFVSEMDGLLWAPLSLVVVLGRKFRNTIEILNGVEFWIGVALGLDRALQTNHSQSFHELTVLIVCVLVIEGIPPPFPLRHSLLLYDKQGRCCYFAAIA